MHRRIYTHMSLVAHYPRKEQYQNVSYSQKQVAGEHTMKAVVIGACIIPVQ